MTGNVRVAEEVAMHCGKWTHFIGPLDNVRDGFTQSLSKLCLPFPNALQWRGFCLAGYYYTPQFLPLSSLDTCSTTQREGRCFFSYIKSELKCVSSCASFVEVDPYFYEKTSVEFNPRLPSKKQKKQKHRFIFPRNVTRSYFSVWTVQFSSDVGISESTAIQFLRPVMLSYFCCSVKRKKNL